MRYVFYFLIIFLFSCKKDSIENPSGPIVSRSGSFPLDANYFPLKIGNYWIYQQFVIDTNGIETPTNNFDSCYVKKDTLIKGKKFFILYRPPYLGIDTKQIIRDSSGYIVDHNGNKIFSSDNFVTSLFKNFKLIGTDTLYTVECYMRDKDLMITVPAGSFPSMNACLQYRYNPFLKITKIKTNFRYAANIGMVVETLPKFIIDHLNYERRLVRYKLK